VKLFPAGLDIMDDFRSSFFQPAGVGIEAVEFPFQNPELQLQR
jgi:hypothetical protein